MAFNFTTATERPTSTRSPRELTAEQAAVLAVFQESVKNGDESSGKFEGEPKAAGGLDTEQVKELKKLIVRAAHLEDMGSRIRVTGTEGDQTVTFWAVSLPEGTLRVICPDCGSTVTLTALNTLRTHGPRDNRCPMSGQEVQVG